jgi:hypothetical protein
MRADRFDDSGGLRGEAGLHAVWWLPRAVPEIPYMAVLHCLAWGRVRVGNFGLRAEVMEVQEIVLHHDELDGILEAVRRRYPACRVRKARKRKRMLVLTEIGSHGTVVNGKFHGRWVRDDGTVGHYRRDMPHGRWIYPDGRTECYHYDLPHGQWTYPDGRVEVYKMGKLIRIGLPVLE